MQDAEARAEACRAFRTELLETLAPLEPTVNGDPERTLPHALNVSFPGLDSEAVIISLKDIAAISNGSACTSQSYELSHVLKAMGVDDRVVQGATRWSWCHMSERPDWDRILTVLRRLSSTASLGRPDQ